MRRIPKIESHKFYLDVAITKAKKRAHDVRQGYSGKLNLFHYKQIELARVMTLSQELQKLLHDILVSFPSLDALTPFYNNLIRSTVDYAELKKSLGALNWALKKIKDFEVSYTRNIKRSREIPTTATHRRDAYGRITSVINQIKSNLTFLEEVRVVFVDYPSVKDMYTVCIAGFPNVGKSTILSKITPAKPEIADYSFTTKKLNLGYMTLNHHKVQVMDTPGTLNRIEKMNLVEKQAYLALQYVANIIIYVFDPSDQATASLADQKKLFKKTQGFEKPILVFLSKTDITPKEKYESLQKEYDAFTNLDDIKKEVQKHI